MGSSHNGFFKGLAFCSSLLIVSSKDIISSHNARSHKIKSGSDCLFSIFCLYPQICRIDELMDQVLPAYLVSETILIFARCFLASVVCRIIFSQLTQNSRQQTIYVQFVDKNSGRYSAFRRVCFRSFRGQRGSVPRQQSC